MQPKRFSIEHILTSIILLLATLATAGGLFNPDIYKETALLKAIWTSNDLVTLVIVIPMTLAVMIFAGKSERAKLVWIGFLGFMLYNYTFYLFGTTFNKFFFLYTVIFGLSVYAFFISLYRLNPSKIRKRFGNRTPVRIIAIYLILTSIPLLVVEGGQCLQYLLYGKLPSAPPLVLAIDLALIIPTSILAGILLWRKKAWGFILSVIMLVKGFSYGLVLTAGVFVVDLNKLAKQDPLLPFYLILVFFGMIGLIMLLRHMRPLNGSMI